MSFNQWKILNIVRESINKISNDKSIHNSFKEISQLVGKLPSTSILNKKLNQYLEARYNSTSDTNPSEPTNYNLPNVFKAIANKVSKSEDTAAKETGPKWKMDVQSQSIISKSSISSRTEFLIMSIETATSDDLLYERIDALINHIKLYPEARNNAVKVGAIRLMLRMRSRCPNELVQGCIREALAILGYSNPVPGKGIRILAIDGGGIRGLLVLEMLKKIEELTNQRVHDLFDYFCGVSTGAILTFSMGIHHHSLDDISHAYEEISKEVFKQSALWGTGNLVWSHSYYDSSLWSKKLKEHLGDATLISTARSATCPKMCAVSAVVNQKRLSAYLFRNYALPWRFQSQYFGSNEHEVWQAARASAAAPTYFEEFKIGNLLHQDGGILCNNPTAIALHEVKLLWPDTPIQCVVSFGTGRTVPIPSEALDFDIKLPEKSPSSSTSWANKFYKILDSATDTEAVHTMLNDLLPENVYYRFNPYLTEMISMVETDPKKIDQLKRDAVMYLRRNEDKFQDAAKQLVAPKSSMQKVKDYVGVQREILGL